MAKKPTPATRPLPRFGLGRVYSTQGALDAMGRYQADSSQLLNRHVTGDWGMVCQEDAQSNEDALRDGSRLLSAYELPPPADNQALVPVKLWIITESDRNVTTILLPEEY